MTFRQVRSLAFISALLLSTAGIMASPRSASAAHSAGTLLFTAAGSRTVAAGGTQKVWVHTMALASVTLKVAYGNGQVITQQGATDAAGVYQFQWTVDYTGASVTLARYWVYVTRGSRSTATRGDFVLFPAPPLGVQMSVLTPSIQVGDSLKVQVHTRPDAALTLSVHGEDGHALLTRTAVADATGNWSFSAPISVTISQPHRLLVVVTSANLAHQASATGIVQLQPALAPRLAGDAGTTFPIAPTASLDQARGEARTVAGGSWTAAQGEAQQAVGAIKVDLQVLAQWTTTLPGHDAAYYDALLAHAKSYDDLVNLTAQAVVDDAPIQARMHEVMPHKAIMVSVADQTLHAYEDGRLVLFTYVTTGRPELPTVTGHFAIYAKITPFEFHSPWPVGSPFYYPPTWIKYWMPFYEGYGLHDAWWRAHYGPGTNIYGDGPGSSEPVGTHGCVNIPFDKTLWLWNWAPVGTPVVVYGGPAVAAGAAGI